MKSYTPDLELLEWSTYTILIKYPFSNGIHVFKSESFNQVCNFTVLSLKARAFSGSVFRFCLQASTMLVETDGSVFFVLADLFLRIAGNFTTIGFIANQLRPVKKQ